MKILCPIDFSMASKHALHASLAIAAQLMAEVVIVHAWYLPMAFAGDLGYPADATERMIADAETLLSTEVQVAKANGFERISSLLVAGPPSEAIVTIVETDPTFELIVIGTNGRTGLSRLVLGSVAERTLRHAPCSVLAIHPTDPIPTFRNILCPLDFSADSQMALDLAIRLARPGGRGISLLHVLELPVAYSGEPSDTEFTKDLDKRSAARLAQAVTATRDHTSVKVESHTRIGSAARQVLAAIDASEPPFEAVIIGSHGRTGFGRFVMGSVAEKVMRHASCPILVARAPHNSHSNPPA